MSEPSHRLTELPVRTGVLPLCLLALLALSACSGRELMPTPNLYVGPSAVNPFADTPPELQSPEMDVMYVTDRRPLEREDNEPLAYGTERSTSLAFGSCVVRIGEEDLTWDELVTDSRTQDREHSLPVSIVSYEETGRFPADPLPIVPDGDSWTIDPDAITEKARVAEELREEIRRRLALTPTKEVFIYVHGVANTLDDATDVVAEFWHFFGRQAVPVAYSWPTKGSYLYDRESGEFTVLHFKAFLAIIGQMPEVERVHLIGHSRGTDVVVTTLRELLIEARGAKADPHVLFKFGNVVLAAPDLDFEVLLQRMSGENFGHAISRLTVYASYTDRAIAMASWLFDSGTRVGNLRPSDLTPALRKRLEVADLAAFVDADVHTGFLGHSYFHDSPAVSSDVILVLLENLAPGAENGRPLTEVETGYWRLDDDYCLPKK